MSSKRALTSRTEASEDQGAILASKRVRGDEGERREERGGRGSLMSLRWRRLKDSVREGEG